MAALKPHGRRWHLEPESQQAWEALKGSLPAGLTAHPLEPSLEDVFLKIVEPAAAKVAAPPDGGAHG